MKIDSKMWRCVSDNVHEKVWFHALRYISWYDVRRIVWDKVTRDINVMESILRMVLSNAITTL